MSRKYSFKRARSLWRRSAEGLGLSDVLGLVELELASPMTVRVHLIIGEGERDGEGGKRSVDRLIQSILLGGREGTAMQRTGDKEGAQ